MTSVVGLLHGATFLSSIPLVLFVLLLYGFISWNRVQCTPFKTIIIIEIHLKHITKHGTDLLTSCKINSYALFN